MADLTHDEEALRSILGKRRRIAVVGASDDPSRDSHGVFLALLDAGHDAVPVNPAYEQVAGRRSFPDLEAAAAHWGAAPEIVDVFRRPEHLPDIVTDAIQADATVLWCQFGVVHDDAIAQAKAAGLDVVVDRCIKVEQRRLVGRARD